MTPGRTRLLASPTAEALRLTVVSEQAAALSAAGQRRLSSPTRTGADKARDRAPARKDGEYPATGVQQYAMNPAGVRFKPGPSGEQVERDWRASRKYL